MKKGEQLSKAILIATLAHEGQFDKGGGLVTGGQGSMCHPVVL